MEKKNVGIWIRVSTEDQAKGDSPEHHQKRAKMYAEVKEWNVVEVYNLEGVSGKQVLNHPEAKRMLWDIKSGKITGLIFSKLARLARNTKELLELSDFFNEHKADLISLEEAVDTSTPSGRLFYTMISAVAQWEREEIVSRVKASVPIRAKLGKRTGGSDPLGYNWVDGELVINKEEAPIRKLVFELYVKEKRKKTVARILNEKGYRTKRGKNFSSQTITQIIRSPLSKGLRRANYTTMHNGKLVQKPEEEWVFVKAPAIVSKELWDECNAIMDSQMVKRNYPSKKRKHIFSKHIRCTCGTKMYVPSSNPTKYVCKNCLNKIPKLAMEEIFHEQLRAFLFSKKDLEKYMGDTKRKANDKQHQFDGLMKKESALKAELNNVIRLSTKGVLADEDFASHYNPVKEQLTQIQGTMSEVQGELDALNQYMRDNEFMLNEARDLYSKWKVMDFEGKRSIVDLIVKDIIVGKDEIDINLLYSPTSVPTHHPLLKGGKKGNYLTV